MPPVIMGEEEARALARTFDMEADALFRATLESIRDRPRLEVVNVDPDGARIQVRERRRFARARTHHVTISDEGDRTQVQVGAAAGRLPRGPEIAAFLESLERRVGPASGDDPDKAP